MTTEDGRTVAELVAVEPAVGSLFDRLGAITASVAEAGVELTVNVEGRLTALSLTPEALARGGDQLAVDIFRLTQRAAGLALSDGLATVGPFAGDELTAELAEIVAIPDQQPEPNPTASTARRRTLDDEDDFSAIETWAVH